MGFALAPSALQAGYRLEVLETTDSTNAHAIRLALAGDTGDLWLVALRQSAGRGRRGRPWQFQPGNLATTLLLRPTTDMREAASLGFVAGLALADALEAVLPQGAVAVGMDSGEVAGGGRFALKWPNDLLVDGAKLSGILLESVILPDGAFAVAIGIGVNVVGHPEDLPYPATSLRALNERADASTLFLALSDAWIDNMRLWRNGRGLAAIRKKWLKRAAGLGSQVAIRADGEVVRGVFETIDEECRFVIRQADGSARRITAGDVHFGAVASAASV